MALVALLPAVMALLKLISWISGIVLIGGYIRDSVVKTKEADVELSEDQTVQDILDRTDISPEQKAALVNKYLGIKDNNELDMNTVLLVVVVLVVLIMAFFYISKKG